MKAHHTGSRTWLITVDHYHNPRSIQIHYTTLHSSSIPTHKCPQDSTRHCAGVGRPPGPTPERDTPNLDCTGARIVQAVHAITPFRGCYVGTVAAVTVTVLRSCTGLATTQQHRCVTQWSQHSQYAPHRCSTPCGGKCVVRTPALPLFVPAQEAADFSPWRQTAHSRTVRRRSASADGTARPRVLASCERTPRTWHQRSSAHIGCFKLTETPWTLASSHAGRVPGDLLVWHASQRR